MGFAPQGNSCEWSEKRSPLSHSPVLDDWRNEVNRHLMAATNPKHVWSFGIHDFFLEFFLSPPTLDVVQLVILHLFAIYYLHHLGKSCEVKP